MAIDTGSHEPGPGRAQAHDPAAHEPETGLDGPAPGYGRSWAASPATRSATGSAT